VKRRPDGLASRLGNHPGSGGRRVPPFSDPRFLSQLGYTVLQAANGSDAMYLAQNHKLPIDLLLTDIVMPGMSGRELAQKFVIKCPASKVLYMSGYTDDTIVRHGIEEGAVALLTKPFTMEAIARKVREVLK